MAFPDGRSNELSFSTGPGLLKVGSVHTSQIIFPIEVLGELAHNAVSRAFRLIAYHFDHFCGRFIMVFFSLIFLCVSPLGIVLHP